MPSLNTEKQKVEYLDWYLGFERIVGIPEDIEYDIKLANIERLPDVKSYRSVQVKDSNEAYTIIENMLIPGNANASWRDRIRKQFQNDGLTAANLWLHVIRYDL